jgi:hypothetical protein
LRFLLHVTSREYAVIRLIFPYMVIDTVFTDS